MKARIRRRNRRIREEPSQNYGDSGKDRTSNVQRSTFNVQRREISERPSDSQFDLEERLLNFAVRILKLVDALPRSAAGRHVADQLLACGTSPLANHGEVQGAESRKDLVHKLRICLKELRESGRWLRLVHRVPLLPPAKVEPLLGETEELIKIFSASIRTAERIKQ